MSVEILFKLKYDGFSVVQDDVRCCGCGGLGESAQLGGCGWPGVPSLANSGYFPVFHLIQKYFKIKKLSLMNQTNLMTTTSHFK